MSEQKNVVLGLITKARALHKAGSREEADAAFATLADAVEILCLNVDAWKGSSGEVLDDKGVRG